MRLVVEFGLQVRFWRAAHPGAIGAAALGHEARDNPVELHTVVKAFVSKLDNPRNMAGGQVRAQLDFDVAAAAEREGKVFGHG